MNNDNALTESSSPSSSLGQYNCPVCDRDLTHLRSSFARQQHVETCLQSNVDAALESQQQKDMDFCYCLFCGKDIQHLSGIRMDVHFNKCLDQLELEAHPSFLRDLEICPCCHEFELFRRAVPQRIAHLKTCMRRRGMTVPQLFKKLQWIEWGHDPKPNRPKPQAPPVSSAKAISRSSTTFALSLSKRATASGNSGDKDDDDDFKAPIFVKKKRQQTLLPQREELDDETRLVLQLSKQKERKPKANPDVCNIVSVEESRRIAAQALQELLFPEFLIDPPVSIYPPIPPTSLSRSTHELTLWELAGTAGGNEKPHDNPFHSQFLRCRKT